MGRLRYFGERVLVEDGSAKSDPTTVVNAMLGYRFGKDAWDLRGEVLNLFDSDDADIAYFYESRFPLPGGGLEPGRRSNTAAISRYRFPMAGGCGHWICRWAMIWIRRSNNISANRQSS